MKKSAKMPLIFLIICVVAAIIFFSVARNYPQYLWAGAAAAGGGIIFLLITLTRFLRNRSITSGLLISTTAVTGLYFLGSRFVSAALPIALTTVAMADVDSATNNRFGFVTPLFLAQVGLFALWFLLILFIIFVYVRPIKKIDWLLSQIIASQEIKKFKLGNAKQYQKIAAKLQILADEKHATAVRQQKRRARTQAKTGIKKGLVKKLIKEKDKIPSGKKDR